MICSSCPNDLSLQESAMCLCITSGQLNSPEFT